MMRGRRSPSGCALCGLIAMLACAGALGCSGKGDAAALEKRIVNLEKKVEALNKRVARAERASRRRRPARPPAPQGSAAPQASAAPAAPSAAK